MSRFIVFASAMAFDPELPTPVPLHAVLVRADSERAAVRTVVDSHVLPPTPETEVHVVDVAEAKKMMITRSTTVEDVTPAETGEMILGPVMALPPLEPLPQTTNGGTDVEL